MVDAEGIAHVIRKYSAHPTFSKDYAAWMQDRHHATYAACMRRIRLGRFFLIPL